MRSLVLALTAAASLGAAGLASAQSEATAPPAPLGSTFTSGALNDLPLSASVLTLGATAEPSTVSDRVDTGGITTGEAARIGAHGASPAETVFYIGNTPVGDADGTGTPLMMPGLLAWERADMATGQLSIETSGPGTVFSLVPKRPASQWGGSIEGIAGPKAWVADSSGPAPPIARSAGWDHGGVFASGPLTQNGIGLAVAGDWTHGFRTDRANASPVSGSLASVFAHLEARTTPRDLVRAFAWGEQTHAPFGNRIAFARTFGTRQDRGVNGEVDWQHLVGSSASAEFFGNYTLRDRTAENIPTSIVIDRLFDGPVDQLLYPGLGTESRWAAGARLRPGPIGGGLHRLQGGIEVTGAGASVTAALSGTISETVNGLSARVWQFDPGGESHWHSTQFSFYIADDLVLHPRFTATLGMRYELMTGSAENAATSIDWRNWLPRASLRWHMFDTANINMFASFERYGSRLPLSWLAYGDPNAPSGRVYAWRSADTTTPPPLASLGPVVSVVGPGLGGQADLVRIDPQLSRPYTEDFIFGWDSHPHTGLTVTLAAMARHEKQNVRLVDVGAPLSAYTPVFQADPGLDLSHTSDDQLLIGYNRLPSTFGADKYLLTNPDGETTSFVGVEMSTQLILPRVFIVAGATAGRTIGFAGYRGFHATENDQDVPGELYVDPNAYVHAHGRLFVDRGYTIKVANTYDLGYGFHLGFTARYQDGQAFARMVIFPDMNQGTEFVRAFANGLSRFTYTTTLDTRFQKQFPIGKRRIDLLLDAYNLINQSNEIEEFTVTGSTPRGDATVSAVQPPRSVQFGVRVTF